MTAQRGYPPLHGEFEYGLDAMNSDLDFFDVRGRDSLYSDTSVGDYEGMHIFGGLALTRRLWIDGGIWSRHLQTPLDALDGYSWQRAIQYQMTINLGKLPALAVRYSQWGNSTDEVSRSSGFTFLGTSAERARITDPADQQTQVDLIATWALGGHETISLFAGRGHSKVTFGNLYAFLKEGCEYRLDSPSVYQISGELTQGDPIACEVIGFNIANRNPIYPGPNMYIAYEANYAHIGGMYSWFNDYWRTRLGFRYERYTRDLDDEIRAAEGQVYDSNLLITGEVGFKFYENFALFFRAQYMSHQLLGEMPFAYNRFTSDRFNRRYGLMTIGIQGGF